jgi:DNA-binding response OmpR family regulator
MNTPEQPEPKPHIVVIDDEPDTLEILKLYLTMFGFDVAGALTGTAGLKHAEAQRPEAVVLDLMLPDLDGLEVCRILRQKLKTPEVPVIILSARTGREDVQKGYEAGATLYLKKPVDMEKLVEECKRVVALGKHVTRPLADQVADADAPATGTSTPIKVPKKTRSIPDLPKS